MIIIEEPYKVKCETCGNEMELDLELECISTYERQMGMELEYEAVCEGECDECGDEFLVRIQAWEYPVGILNMQTEELEGVKALERAAVSVEEEKVEVERFMD